MEDQEENLFIIPDFEKLIETKLSSETSKLLATSYSKLDNAGSTSGFTILRIVPKLLNISTGEELAWPMIGKTLQRNGKRVDCSYAHKIFKKEYGLLMVAKPALQKFLSEKGITQGTDYFPRTYGGRMNLSGNDTVDHNAAIIFQDYAFPGFRSLKGSAGLDLEASNIVIKALAKLHATFLSFKLQYPKEFEDKVIPHLDYIYIKESLEQVTERHMLDVLKENNFPQDVIDRALLTFRNKSVKEVREPWATFIHNDLSLENMIIGWNTQSKPTYAKFLDYTKSEYGSPLRDLIFFLFSSVQLSVLKNYLDDLLDLYYYTLVKNLKFLKNVDNDELFCRLAFNRELKAAAGQSEFYRLMCKLHNISIIEYTENNCDNFVGALSKHYDSLLKDRVCYITKEFDKRGWLTT